MHDPLETASRWLRAGRIVVLATVVETWGSAPRRPGSLMAIDDGGQFVGSVSGGCVEVAVIEASRDPALADRPAVLEFGVSDDEAWAVGLACGGRIRVRVARARQPVVDAVLEARRAQRPVALAQHLGRSDERVVMPDASSADALQTALADTLRTDQARVVEAADGEWLLAPLNPPLRLVVVGAVHIAEALCAMARLAGHAVTLVDPRTAFLRPALFPGVTLSGEWPQQALPALAPDARCAAVLLTHDPKIDDPALEILLRSPVYYIGALGSRRTHAKRLERLAAAGFTSAELARIHGPAGLPIGARTPAEIAVSVLAELTAALRNPAAS